MSGFLIIGYGNTLRGDDGVGPRVAEAIAGWGLPNVRAISTAQLTPELAEALAGAEVVIFVDAQIGQPASTGVSFKPVAPDEKRLLNTHSGDPRRLLALTMQLYGRSPSAWLVAIPGVNFDFGETLSTLARRGMDEALQRIRALLTGQQNLAYSMEDLAGSSAAMSAFSTAC